MRSLRIALALFVLFLLGGRVFAQAGATGTVLGTVTDQSGAIVQGAKVTITNVATNVSFKTVTSSSGDFNGPDLTPGAYKVTVEAQGFQRAVTQQFQLTVNQKVRVDVAMKPGTVNETLEVTAQSVALDTDTAELSNLVSQTQVENLPSERPQLHAASPGGGGSGDGWRRAGNDAAGAGKRDQRERRPAGGQQLHAGRIGEHGRGAGDSRRSSFAGRHSGIQGFERNLLRRSGLQRDADQHCEQGRHQQPARSGVLFRSATMHSTPGRFRPLRCKA